MTAFQVPVSGLADLAPETRVLATPWSRMVRGIGLGQHPIPYDPEAEHQIRHAFALLAAKGVGDHGYARFAKLLAEFILAPGAIAADVEPVLSAMRSEQNPYFRVMAGCILMDACAKLGRGELLTTGGTDLPAEMLALVDTIQTDNIKDENAGRHGHYEKLSASTAVFLAIGQLGAADRLVTDRRDHVREALALLDQIPAPFFRGRGGSMLLSAVMLLGYGDHVDEQGRDHLEELLRYLDRAAELDLPPAFPQPMSEAFAEIYPLLTTLNTIAWTGRPDHYLTHGRDRLTQARELWAAIRPVERTHMGLYYLMALNNLGRLPGADPRLDEVVEEVVGQWVHLDPGANYFLNGISYPYIIQTAMLTGRMDLITPKTLDRMIDGFPDLDRTPDDRVNRPYPFAYAFNVLAEIGQSRLLFEPRAAYGGSTPIGWVIEQLSPGGREEPRLYMLYHALLSFALRLRGRDGGEGALFGGLRSRGVFAGGDSGGV